jgi:hypothetical protein
VACCWSQEPSDLLRAIGQNLYDSEMTFRQLSIVSAAKSA